MTDQTIRPAPFRRLHSTFPVAVIGALALAGCVEATGTPAPQPQIQPPAPAVPPTVTTSSTSDLPLFGAGFRSPGDTCRRVGESDYTNQFLDDSADLVGCPLDVNQDLFASQTGGNEVARHQGYVLYRVPRR